MDVSTFVLLSHEQALRRRLDVAANNMANTGTAGFKREQPLFHDYLETGTGGPLPAADTTAFVLDYGATHDASAGSFQRTANPLDVMIDGPGYLSVADGSGATAYTRAGLLHISDSGQLVTATGQALLDAAGRPIGVPADQQAGLTIGPDGSVSGPAGPIGRLGVTVFDEVVMVPRGDGMFDGEGGRLLTAAETRLKTGGIEASNVEPITETTAMVEILRAYQSSQKLNDSINDMRSRTIERLSRSN